MASDLSGYVHGHSEAVVNSHARRTAETYANHALPHLAGCTSVLDVGCGPGSITVGFARHLAAGGRVVGVDLSPEVLERARAAWRSAPEGQVGTTCEFREASVYELPFADGEFDMVHAHQVLQHLQEPVRALREMCRVSRRFVCVREMDFASWRWYPEEPRMEAWKEMAEKTFRSNGCEPFAGRHLRRWLREAGLEPAQVALSAEAVCYASAERTREWGETWAERATTSSMADQAVEFGHASREALLEMAAGWRAWMVHEDALLHYTSICAVADQGEGKSAL